MKTSFTENSEYLISLRTIVKDKVSIYTDVENIDVYNNIDFDIKKSGLTSMNYFASSLVSEILFCLSNTAKKENILLEDLEAIIKIYLKNPLTLLDVRGYDESSYIDKIELNIYLYYEISEEEFKIFLDKVYKKCFIYNSIKDSIDINIRYQGLI